MIAATEIIKVFWWLSTNRDNYAQMVVLENDMMIAETIGIHAIGPKDGRPEEFQRCSSTACWRTFLAGIDLSISSQVANSTRKATRPERKRFYKIIPEYLAAIKLSNGVVDEQVVSYFQTEELLTHFDERIRKGARKFVNSGD